MDLHKVPQESAHKRMAIQPADLQKLIKEPSGDVRVEVAEHISSGFAEGMFSEAEKKIAVEIFRLLVKDAEIKVRKMLSYHLAQSMEAPHDVILSLARDVTEVATDVLAKSYVLTEDDLVAITQSTQDIAVMSTIARRDTVSRELSSALLEKANTAVVEVLLNNKGAVIDEKGFHTIYQQCNSQSSVLDLMVNRGGLPVVLAEKLFVAVSDEMKKVLTKQYKLSVQVADQSVAHARELATLGLVAEETKTLDIEKLVGQLYQQGRLSFSIIIRSLCYGDMRFFEQAMAKLADVPLCNAQLLILDRGKEGFESLYKTSCLPMELFQATQYLLQRVQEETAYGRFQRNDFRKRLADRLIQDDEARKIEYMEYLITLIQHNARDAVPVS